MTAVRGAPAATAYANHPQNPMTSSLHTERTLSPRMFWLLCAALCLLALALRLPTLASRSLWLDETYSAWFSAIPLHELWSEVPLYETHPPMYYTLLKGWRDIFGATEPALRSLSVLASVLNVALLACAARFVRGGALLERVALLAALLLAIHPGHIEYAQQARPYALQALAASAAILASLVLLQQLRASTPAPVASLWRWSAVLGVSTGATLWLHNTGMFIAVAIWLGMMAAADWSAVATRRRTFLVIAGSGVLAIAIWLPFLPMFLKQRAAMATMNYWLAFKLDELLTMGQLVGGRIIAIPLVAALCIVGLLAIRRQRSYVATHLFIVLLVPLFIIVAYSVAIKSIFIPRLFVWTIPVIAGIVAAALAYGMKRLAFQAVLGLAIGALWLSATIGFYGKETEDWRGLIAKIAAQAQPNDLIIALPNEITMPFAYYGGSPRLPEVFYVPQKFPATALPRPYVGNLAAPGVIASDVAIQRELLPKYGTIWLIERRADIYDPAGIIEKELQLSKKLVQTYRSVGISIKKYQ